MLYHLLYPLAQHFPVLQRPALPVVPHRGRGPHLAGPRHAARALVHPRAAPPAARPVERPRGHARGAPEEDRHARRWAACSSCCALVAGHAALRRPAQPLRLGGPARHPGLRRHRLPRRLAQALQAQLEGARRASRSSSADRHLPGRLPGLPHRLELPARRHVPVPHRGHLRSTPTSPCPSSPPAASTGTWAGPTCPSRSVVVVGTSQRGEPHRRSRRPRHRPDDRLVHHLPGARPTSPAPPSRGFSLAALPRHPARSTGAEELAVFCAAMAGAGHRLPLVQHLPGVGVHGRRGLARARRRARHAGGAHQERGRLAPSSTASSWSRRSRDGPGRLVQADRQARLPHGAHPPPLRAGRAGPSRRSSCASGSSPSCWRWSRSCR